MWGGCRRSDRCGRGSKPLFKSENKTSVGRAGPGAREGKGTPPKKTYNTRDSLVVTDPTTSLALTGLSMGERTGSRVLQWVWSYVVEWLCVPDYVRRGSGTEK